MAKSLPPYTWENGYIQPAKNPVPAWADEKNFTTEDGLKAHYVTPDDAELPTSTVENSFGLHHLRSWPAIYNGTAALDDAAAESSKSSGEVDVLICGAGPFGLEVAVTLARQNLTFRIVDKADKPCLTGRADALQPRAIEFLQMWGVGSEATESGPLLNSTVLIRNGVQLYNGASSMCDSQVKGVHVVTQGMLEKTYIRDLNRHGVMVERNTTVESFITSTEKADAYPVTANVRNLKTGKLETVRSKYLVGADGAASRIREQLGIPFDGLATDAYWAIMDCQFKTDYPHIREFGVIISAEHGGSIIVPREDGFTRFYVQVNGEMLARMKATREERRAQSKSGVGETQIQDHGITPDEALALLNKVIAPWTVEFACELSWFAVWRVNERVARTYSSPDQRVQIGGDAAHVHSVLGAFGLNSSIYDAANLGWKLGMSARGVAKPEKLLPTYDNERRLFANRVIRVSGAYLRFICNLNAPLAELHGLDGKIEAHEDNYPPLDGTTEADRAFVRAFFGRNVMFLIGVEGQMLPSVICAEGAVGPSTTAQQPTSIRNGVRAPNPRVAHSLSETGYLYDRMRDYNRFSILVFGSDLQGPVRNQLCTLVKEFGTNSSFYTRYGGPSVFNVLLITKMLPRQVTELLQKDTELAPLRDLATLVYDDRAPDEDAHYWYQVNHARGAVIVVRPDLVVGTSAWPDNLEPINNYFAGFLNDGLPN